MNGVRTLLSLYTNYSLRVPGVPLNVVFKDVMSAEQRAWLRLAPVPLQSITFCTTETASDMIMEPVSASPRAALYQAN